MRIASLLRQRVLLTLDNLAFILLVPKMLELHAFFSLVRRDLKD